MNPTIDHCNKDYNNRHHWEKVGIKGDIIIYQCSQCRLCAYEKIKFIGEFKTNWEINNENRIFNYN